MSGEANQAVIRHFYQLINTGKLDQIDGLFTGDYVDHNPQAPAASLAGLKQLLMMVTTAFPDFQITVEDMIDEGDKVVARLRLGGTHRGPFMGIPPTGKQALATGLSIFRLANSQIAEEWFLFDALGLVQHLSAAPSPAVTSSQENTAIIRRVYEELLSQGNLAVADELFAPSFVAHFLPPGMPPGVEGLKLLVNMYRAAFPDLQFAIEDLISQGDLVVARATTSGTHLHAFMGQPATGKRVAVAGIDMFRLQDGKVVEQWLNRDDLGLLQQLGMIPAPDQTGVDGGKQ